MTGLDDAQSDGWVESRRGSKTKGDATRRAEKAFSINPRDLEETVLRSSRVRKILDLRYCPTILSTILFWGRIHSMCTQLKLSFVVQYSVNSVY